MSASDDQQRLDRIDVWINELRHMRDHAIEVGHDDEAEFLECRLDGFLELRHSISARPLAVEAPITS